MPTAKLEGTHASFVKEFNARGEELIPWVLAEVGSDFVEYVAWLDQHARGLNLPAGFVANSTFWLVDGRLEIVGVSNLRHTLNDSLRQNGGHIGFGVRPSARRQGYGTEILRQTLRVAASYGIHEALLTCDKGNIGSVKAILRNGGELTEEEYMEEHAFVMQRYWIRNLKDG